MPGTLFLIFTYFSEALIVYSYANSIYKPKRSSLFSFSVITSFYMILMIVYRYLFNFEILNAVLITAVNIFLIKSVFKSTLKSSVYQGTMLCIIQYISEFLSLFIISLSMNTNIASEAVVSERYKIITVLSRVLYFFISRLLIQLSAKENKSKSWGRWFLLSLLPVSSIFIIVVIRNLTIGTALDSYQNIICILSVFFLLIVNVIVFMIYERAEKSSQKLIELEIVSQKNDIDLKYLSLLEKKNEQMQIMAHDYKNHILTIDSMSDSPEIKEYISEMLGEISQYNRAGKTKNRLLDVILSKYSDICASNGIRFETDIMNDNLSFIESSDTSALFNNIFDNCVEAAEKSEEKYIILHISNIIGSYHKITAINSCDIAPNSKNGRLITTKGNKEAHGFGTKSIKKIVKKYNGEMQWEYDEAQKQFKLVILIPIEQQK